jgi:hypothetical protein
MDLKPYDVRDPAQLIAEIARQVDLVEDTAWLALVHRPSTTQELLEVRALELPALLDDGEDISESLCSAVQAFGLDWRRDYEHAVVSVVVRPGRCVFGPNELVWSLGWRYTNHLEAVFGGDLILVTEHGWLDLMTKEAGFEPAMLPLAPDTVGDG